MPLTHGFQQKFDRVYTLDDAGPPLIALAGKQSAPRESGAHQHPTGQLIGLFEGLLSVRTDKGAWVLPTTRAAWIPPSTMHAARSHGPFSGWATYVSPRACAALPDEPRIIEVTGLLREAIVRAAEWDYAPLDSRQRSIAAVILDEIAGSAADAFSLPMPADARLLRIATALADAPADTRTLETWSEWAHVAPRTVSRRFVAETGLTFTAWRQRARLMRALELLAAGEPVTSVALELGYDNASAFIALSRRTFGTTPGRYFAAELTTIRSGADALPTPAGARSA